MSPTLRQALQHATDILAAHSDSARLDAEVLLAHVLNKGRAHLFTWPEQVLSGEQAQQFFALVEQRATGKPIAYITGMQEFWSLALHVTPDTLIPRPDTEVLVEAALTLIPKEARYTIADLGTGSGAIALAIASERPHCRVIGVDQSDAAVAVARDNAIGLHIDNVQFQVGHWLDGFGDQSLDIIVSNPPYIAEADPHLGQGDVRFEPRSALQAGPEGMDDYKQIVPAANRCLRPGGWLLLEHGYEQQAGLIALLEAQGFEDIRGLKDYGGRDRVVMGRN